MQADDWGVHLKKEKLRTLCEVEWPSRKSEWPKEGSLEEDVVNSLWRSIVNDKALADQLPYISTWKANVDKNPFWLRKCRSMPPQAKVCAVRKQAALGEKPEKPEKSAAPPARPPVLQAPPEEEGGIYWPPPPSYFVPTAPPPPGPEAGAGGDSPTSPAEKAGPVTGAVVPLPSPASPAKAEEDSGGDEENFYSDIVEFRRKLDEGKQWTEERLKLVTEFIAPYQNKGDVSEWTLKIAHCKEGEWKKKQKYLRTAFDKAAMYRELEAQNATPVGPVVHQPTKLAPLRRVYDPPRQVDGALVRTFTFQYVPFTSTDLCNWKNQNPPFEEDPAKIIRLFEGVFRAYKPTYDDIRQLMDTILTSEEARKVHAGAREYLSKERHLNDAAIDAAYPRQSPNWDYTKADDMKLLESYQEYVIEGMKRAAKKPINFSKIRELTQNPDESPGAFLERLKDAYRRHTTVDPDDEANAIVIKTAFVSQAAPDIRRKIQKRESFLGHSLEWMLNLAQTAYNQREEENQRQKERYHVKKLMALRGDRQPGEKRPPPGALQGPGQAAGARGRGRGRIGRNQCALCWQEGHWRRDCPQALLPAPAPNYQPVSPWASTLRPQAQPWEPQGDRPGPAAKGGSREPMVRIETGNQTIPFMGDTGAAYSVVPDPIAKPSNESISIIGATGQTQRVSVLSPVICKLGGTVVQHKFIYVPDCPIPLLGRDLLTKLQAQITFEPSGEVTMSTIAPNGLLSGELIVEAPLREYWRLMVVQEEESPIPQCLLDNVDPEIWAEENPPGMAKNIPPIVVKPKPFANPVSARQYPIPRQAAEGVWVHLKRLIQYGILTPCQSQWNSPLLPVRKEGGGYRPVEALRLVNQAIETLHPNVPNPYTLLSLIPPRATRFTVLDLKDAFFCCRLAPESQHLFAFQWTDPDTGTKTQYTWTRLPQGFKNSPTLFGVALATDLASFPTSPDRVLLQYVDDLLLCCVNEDTCLQATQELLNHLAAAGYRVSKAKAQICQPVVKYLGFDISHQQRSLRDERKQAIVQIPEPRNRKELRGFLGSAGFCRVWIPNYSAIAQPLHESTRGTEKDPFVWGAEQQQAFQKLKEVLLQAPALGIPNPEKPFTLFVDEEQGIAKGVLCQKLGSWQQPIAYLSEKLTVSEQGLPPCMRAVVAVATMLTKADKFTFGQETTCVTPHAVPALLDMKGTYFLSQAKMRKCQTLLTHPRLQFKVTEALNPATLLPVNEEAAPSHDCIQVMDEIYSSRPDLKDEANPKWPSWFVDGSSFIEEGQRKAGYAIVSLQEGTIEALPLPPGTSAQLAEIIALTRALWLAEGMDINIYTDSKYAFLTLHAHGILWKERGLLTSRGNQVQHPQALMDLLNAVWAPRQLAVIHCYGHRTGSSETARGNRLADQIAKNAAKQLSPAFFLGSLIPEKIVDTSLKPPYTIQERMTAESEHLAVTDEGWYLTPDNRVWVPESLGAQVVRRYHESCHLGPDALTKQLGSCYYITKLFQLSSQASRSCILCQKNNQRTGPLPPVGIQHRGTAPMEDIEVDFTTMTKCGFYHYILVAVCSYTGWVEAWPTRTEKASEVTRCLLKEIVPRYGLPRSIGSDNGPAFVHKVLQELAVTLQIDWKLHSAYRPQSSGKVERMNKTFKNQLAKLTQTTGGNWVAMLPLALLRIRSIPHKNTRLSPFELMFGRPVPYVRMMSPIESHDLDVEYYVQSLSRVFSSLNRWTQARTPCVLVEPLHPFEPGDEVWIKDWSQNPLQPRWRGPHTVLLSTPTAIKVTSITPWVHHTRVKKVVSDWTATPDPQQPLRLTISRLQPTDDHSPGVVSSQIDDHSPGVASSQIDDHSPGVASSQIDGLSLAVPAPRRPTTRSTTRRELQRQTETLNGWSAR
nr:uncharacterized protein LOC118083565 [Zootoca vivipara]